MLILVTGATGFVGKSLIEKLLSMGHGIHLLTRDPLKAKAIFPQKEVIAFKWKNNLELPPLESIKDINGVINLMGENIAAKRWSDDQKIILKESRVDSTKNLVKLIEKNIDLPLEFFISASAVGIYPVNTPEILTEDSKLGSNFLAELCKQWEDATIGITKTKRKVIIRTGVVFEKNGGALKKMLLPFQLGLGGPIGDGQQMMSWIELSDLVNIYIACATDNNYSGVYNGVAPFPVNNLDFTKALGSALHRPTILPLPKFILKQAFGEMASVILDSQVVVPKRLQEIGFHFQYETVDKALNAIFKKE